MFKRPLLAAFLSLVTVLAVGAAATVSSAATPNKIQIAWFGTKANAFYAAELKGVQSEAKKRGARVTVFDSAFDPNKQFSQVQDAITTKKFQGFIIVPVNGAALVPVVKKALAARIKVVGANGPLGPNPNAPGVQIKGVSGQVWTSTVTRGQLMARQMIAACVGIDPCKVAYHAGIAAIPIEQTVKKYFEAAIKQQPNIDYVGYYDGNKYTIEGGQKIAQDILTAHPDINVIASGDQAALGAALAVKAAGKTPGSAPGQVRLLGIGSAGVVLDAIKAGELFNSQADAATAEGTYSVQTLVAAVNKKLKRPAVIDPITRSGKPQVINKVNVSTVKADY